MTRSEPGARRDGGLAARWGLGWLPFERSVEWLEETRLGSSSLLHWLEALGAFLAVWLVTGCLHAVILARLKKVSSHSQTKVDDVIVDVLGATRWYFHAALGLLLARHFIELGAGGQRLFSALTVIGVGLQVGIWLQSATLGTVRLWTRQRPGGQHATVAAGIEFISRLVIWVAVILVILSNLGVQISAVIAGLGVGGIAAALAVQGILSDLFAGLSMYFDRPFDIGDAISIDQISGTVRQIGLRTTRIAATSGEEIVFPNGDLVKARIRNFARLRERRIAGAFGVEYGVAPEKIVRAKEIVIETIRGLEELRLDRVHFKGLGASALEFEVIYFVRVPDYLKYMDLQEELWLSVYRRFDEEKIPLAFPSQTVYLRNQAAEAEPPQPTVQKGATA